MLLKSVLFLFLTINNTIFAESFLNNVPHIRSSKCCMNSKDFDFRCTQWDGKKIDTLIFEGGGVRAVVYSGAIKKLEEVDMLKCIKNIAGTSSGAQTAALLCCGYKSNEIKSVLKMAPWKKILDGGFTFRGIYFLLTKYGFYNPNFLENYLDHLIFLKTGIRGTTFEQLYNISNIHLKIGVCSLKDQKFKYIDHVNYPEMPVAKGLLASSSIPLLFTTTKYNNECFTDGGLVGNLPTTSFPKNNCLAFTLFSKNEFKHEKENPNNLVSFAKIVLNILVDYAREIYSSKNRYIENIDFIEIYTGDVGILDTNMNENTINELTEYGYFAVESFLSRKF